MNKNELINITRYFGEQLPAGHITNRDTRIAIVCLYSSLAAAMKVVEGELEALRNSLIGDRKEEVAAYGALMAKAADESLPKGERMKAKAEADAMTECAKIDADFHAAADKILNEEVTADIRKVSLEVLYDALSDCGFPTFSPDMPIVAVEQIFKPVLK